MLLTLEEVEHAYDELKAQTKVLHNAARNLVNAKDVLAKKQTVLINTGEIVGKNQSERDAKAMELCLQEFQVVADTEQEYSDKSLAYELAEREVEKLRLLIRLIEITKEN